MNKPLTIVPYLLIALLLIVLDASHIAAGFKSTLDTLVVPTKQSLYRFSVSVSQIPAVLSHYRDLTNVRESLRTLTALTTTQSEELAKLREENSHLRAQLDAPLPSSYQFLPAPVLGISRFMDIGVGEKDGVRPGMPVVVGTLFIGEVFEVGEKRSSIMLVTDTQIDVAAKTSRGVKGTLSGQSGQGSILAKVLQKDPLFLGDTVYTQSEKYIPGDLTVGTISYINVSDAAVYKQAKVTLPIDVLGLGTVFVIIQL